ncbi:hypothetical protein PUN28_017778 [Cardiocondyla obscurior]|uniref:Uncharacterized protein n=1 Tax=Cardiocondyla obscurior TaxID=286306 RepID=A0AAW2EJ35_9HYME
MSTNDKNINTNKTENTEITKDKAIKMDKATDRTLTRTRSKTMTNEVFVVIENPFKRRGLLSESGAKAVAYADDLTLVIERQSQVELEQK